MSLDIAQCPLGKQNRPHLRTTKLFLPFASVSFRTLPLCSPALHSPNHDCTIGTALEPTDPLQGSRGEEVSTMAEARALPHGTTPSAGSRGDKCYYPWVGSSPSGSSLDLPARHHPNFLWSSWGPSGSRMPNLCLSMPRLSRRSEGQKPRAQKFLVRAFPGPSLIIRVAVFKRN